MTITTNKMGSPSSPSPPTRSSSSSSEPTMSEFKAFHGMVCNPVSAQKCIDYFNGGALFASQHDYATTNDLSFLDFTRTPIPLNLFTYYTLVLCSGTGFLSLLGQTKAPLIQDEHQVILVVTTPPETDQEDDTPVVESKQLYKIPGAKSLTIPRSVLWYIVDRSRDWNQDETAAVAVAASTTTKEVHLIRRFEFEFGALLSVIMCHFECNGRRFLVEVYAFHHSNNNPVTRIIAFLMATVQKLLFALAQIMNKKKKTKER